MEVDQLRDYCLSKKGCTESFPFDEFTLVFKVGGKMFAITGLDAIEPSVNLKCDPERSIELREKYPEIKPGFHMNKSHWNTVELRGNLNERFIRELIDHSYDLIVGSLPLKKRKELEQR